MSEKNNNRTLLLHLRLTLQEYDQLRNIVKKTTCRKLSDYSRKVFLSKLVVEIYRNTSLNDFMTEMIKLRSDLNSIGNNFNL